MNAEKRAAIAVRVSNVTIAVNIILCTFKLAAGIAAGSGAMVSDAIHSASDVFATLIVILGMQLSKKAADTDHPYGHERLECVASVALALILAATGAGIGWSGLGKILGDREALAVPGALALAAAVVSILVKEAMYWYTRAAAKRIDSGSLMAEAWHHRSDALSSVGSFVGILGARMGLPILDPIASVIICLFILKVAVDILRDAIGKLTDRACPAEEVEEMRRSVLAQPGVLGLDTLNTRLFGDRVYVDVEIRADGDQSLREAHATAQKVHDVLESTYPRIKHCMVHVNPDGEA